MGRGDWGEIRTIQEMETYSVVEPPPGANVIGCVWAPKKKRGANNEVIKFKARLCAQGFSQVPGIDFNETASPTARLSSIRLDSFLLSLLRMTGKSIKSTSKTPISMENSTRRST